MRKQDDGQRGAGAVRHSLVDTAKEACIEAGSLGRHADGGSESHSEEDAKTIGKHDGWVVVGSSEFPSFALATFFATVPF